MLKGLSEIAQNLERRINTQRSEVAIVELNEKDDSAILDSIFRFQYFPATITDSYQTNYSAQNIPGASLPIYQWVNGGPRTISFEAIFTCDTDLLANGSDAGIKLNSRLEQMGLTDRNIDIRSAIVWLRRFMLPRYENSQIGSSAALTYAPRKIQLILVNSGIGITNGLSRSSVDTIYCHMTQCEVMYQMFHPSGLPKIVKIQLSFDQVAQIAGGVNFPSADGLDNFKDKTNDLQKGYFAYPLKATGKAREGLARTDAENADAILTSLFG